MSAVQETIYLGNTPVALYRPGTGFYYVYADQIDAPRAITRASDNKIVWSWANADPFGMIGPNETLEVGCIPVQQSLSWRVGRQGNRTTLRLESMP